MIRNPTGADGGKLLVPTLPAPAPAPNREIVDWFTARQRRLNVAATTQTPSGQTLDWIPIASQQPGGRIASPPPAPQTKTPGAPAVAARFELEDQSVARGPAGTVPVLRKKIEALHETTSLAEYLSKRGGLLVNKDRPHDPGGPADPNPFGFFHATSGQTTTAFGCEGWLEVWDPFVESSSGHSIMHEERRRLGQLPVRGRQPARLGGQ